MAADDLDKLAKQAQKQLDEQKKIQQQMLAGFDKLEATAKQAFQAAKQLDELSK
jgi:hypothetical protein